LRDGMKRWTNGLPGATKRLGAIMGRAIHSGTSGLAHLYSALWMERASIWRDTVSPRGDLEFNLKACASVLASLMQEWREIFPPGGLFAFIKIRGRFV